jgi:pimeloyl-ACP methyl ester carboxylesterase
LVTAIDWLSANAATRDLAIGLFGASTGAAAALVAAARRPNLVGAVVSRGGRPARPGRPGTSGPDPASASARSGRAGAQPAGSLHMAVAPESKVVAAAISRGARHPEQVADLAAAWFDHTSDQWRRITSRSSSTDLRAGHPACAGESGSESGPQASGIEEQAGRIRAVTQPTSAGCPMSSCEREFPAERSLDRFWSPSAGPGEGAF